jgi:alpha-glucuronidase
MKINYSLTIVLVFLIQLSYADDGHNLWLRRATPKPVKVVSPRKSSAVLEAAIAELKQNWQGEAEATISLILKADKQLKIDGFKIDGNNIQAVNDHGLLYGVYELLRAQHLGKALPQIISNPSYQLRILNHWDNLDGSVERGYAGKSLFWRGEADLAVTEMDRKLWHEYARANASIGINGSVVNNVNASPRILDMKNLQRAKEIADILRPYGIKTYLSANFSSPVRLGGLKTSDPLDPEVKDWWARKTKEIYSIIPDFGGFLIKANSEGQPGPQDFGRTHADGANMLADILKPYGGILMWRAFVYSPTDKDRAGQSYVEFMPLDGQFRDNVIIQVKNGPIDFQPREPFSALFGAMKKTAVMPEFQITQEYLGHSFQLVFLSPMWEEVLMSDTYQEGPGSTVARTTDGSIFNQKYSAIAGVANAGLDSNWTGHHFAQANWYAFGRLAWNNQLKSEQIADEWLRLTFSALDGKSPESAQNASWETNFLKPVKQMMLESREVAVNYSMPLGLHHIFAANDHYGPGPWYAPRNQRPDWTPPYYHQASAEGVGFNRTKTGSNTVSQYKEPLASQFSDLANVSEDYLLWFHHLPWDYKTKSGRLLWDELCFRYDSGVKQVRNFQVVWDKVRPFVDEQRFADTQRRLRRQTRDAQIWKDGCLLYFQQFSKREIPVELERPVHDLNYLQKIKPLAIGEW